MDHLKFEKYERRDGKKTDIYAVVSYVEKDVLGYIRWHGPWRQYVFGTNSDVIWSWDCLKQVSEFIKKLMDERKHGN